MSNKKVKSVKPTKKSIYEQVAAIIDDWDGPIGEAERRLKTAQADVKEAEMVLQGELVRKRAIERAVTGAELEAAVAMTWWDGYLVQALKSKLRLVGRSSETIEWGELAERGGTDEQIEKAVLLRFYAYCNAIKAGPLSLNRDPLRILINNTPVVSGKAEVLPVIRRVMRIPAQVSKPAAQETPTPVAAAKPKAKKVKTAAAVEEKLAPAKPKEKTGPRQSWRQWRGTLLKSPLAKVAGVTEVNEAEPWLGWYRAGLGPAETLKKYMAMVEMMDVSGTTDQKTDELVDVSAPDEPAEPTPEPVPAPAQRGLQVNDRVILAEPDERPDLAEATGVVVAVRLDDPTQVSVIWKHGRKQIGKARWHSVNQLVVIDPEPKSPADAIGEPTIDTADAQVGQQAKPYTRDELSSAVSWLADAGAAHLEVEELGMNYQDLLRRDCRPRVGGTKKIRGCVPTASAVIYHGAHYVPIASPDGEVVVLLPLVLPTEWDKPIRTHDDREDHGDGPFAGLVVDYANGERVIGSLSGAKYVLAAGVAAVSAA